MTTYTIRGPIKKKTKTKKQKKQKLSSKMKYDILKINLMNVYAQYWIKLMKLL